MKAHNIWVMDIETLANLFTLTAVHVDNDDTKIFVIHDSRSDYPELVKFIQSDNLGFINFNGLSFDDVVIYEMMINIPNWMRLHEANQWDRMARDIYSVAQRTIEAEYSGVAPWDMLYASRDLFKIHHFNNKAKRTSLKAVEISIKWHDVMDMPISHEENINASQIDEILMYNLNDVLATKALYELTKPMLAMRRDLGRRYGLPLMNVNDVKIGELITLKYISEQSNIETKFLKTLRTKRNTIDLKDCVLPYIKFTSKEFLDVLHAINNTTINAKDTKGGFTQKVYFDGMRYDFGLGGLHAVRESSIYHTDNEKFIKSWDVRSFYPNLAIKNNFYPAHLGNDFCVVYEKLYNERITAPKGSTVNKGLKLAINGVYGLSNNEYSFLYDPKFTMSITINGQLSLAMLCEKLTLTGIGKIIAVNTDGIECIISKKNLPRARQIVKNWEKLTNLILEEDTYSRLWYRDINNYIAEFDNGSIYTKGAYEWENRPFHKDTSMLIVPRAVQEYFVNGTPILDTLKASTNIFEFCLSMRSAKGADFYMQHMTTDENGNHNIMEEKLQRTNRFLVIKDGGMLIKKFSSGKQTRIRSPYKMQILNLILDIDKPNTFKINFDFYEIECYKLIQGIEHHQINLFNG